MTDKKISSFGKELLEQENLTQKQNILIDLLSKYLNFEQC